MRPFEHARVVVALVLLAGCASLPPPPAKAPEHAFAAPQTTALGKKVLAAEPANEVSGFRMLQAGADAFAALQALIDGAQHSLDLQYYLVRDEPSTRVLLRRIYAAAERGVKVRMLVDD